MKKILFFLALIFTIGACSSDDDNNTQASYEVLPVAYCHMPYEFMAGETYHITLYYKLPTTCYFYKGLYFEKDGNKRTVAIQSCNVQRSDCQAISYSEENINNDYTTAEFDFKADGAGPYTFRFWTGKDNSGADTYYEEEIPVVN